MFLYANICIILNLYIVEDEAEYETVDVSEI